MMVILTLLYILTGLVFVSFILGFFNDKKIEFTEKDIVQGIKKRSIRNIPKTKPKITTDMIKVNGKTKVVKRDKKGHFVK